MHISLSTMRVLMMRYKRSDMKNLNRDGIGLDKVVARANTSIMYGTVRRADARLTSKVIVGVSDQARRAHTRFCIQTTAQHTCSHIHAIYVSVYVYTSRQQPHDVRTDRQTNISLRLYTVSIVRTCA